MLNLKKYKLINMNDNQIKGTRPTVLTESEKTQVSSVVATIVQLIKDKHL